MSATGGKIKVEDIYAETHSRLISFEREAVSADDRTVSLSFSSEEPVERWFGMEILDHSSKACDLARLKRGGPLLLNHNPDDQIGVVESCEIDEKTKKGRAVVRFSKSEEAEKIFQDVKDGIRKNVSVGYGIRKIVREKEEDGLETYRVTRWDPFEISIVSIPADTKVGVGRNKEQKNSDQMRILLDPAPQPGGGGTPAPAPAPAPSVNVQEITSNTRQAELTRVREINSLAKRHKVEDLIDEAIDKGTTVDAFRTTILERQYNGGKPLVPATASPAIGMSEKEKRSYSIVRAMNLMANKRPLDGLELEASNAVAKASKRDPDGFFVPFEVTSAPIPSQGHRTMSVNNQTTGGILVDTTAAGQSMIELLRNKMMVSAMGARSLSSLVGNVAIPRQTGGATAYWLDEQSAVTASDQALGQLALTPHRLAGLTKYSKQLLAQGSIDVEGFVRSDLTTVLAIAKDAAAIGGVGGAGEPIGILNTTGVNSVTFGAAATWAKVLDFEKEVDVDNALSGSLGWLTTPAVRAKWKAAVKVASQAQFLWEADNRVNGYRAETTNQFPSGDKVIFGNWNDLILADWDGIDVVVDPYSLADTNLVRIVITVMTDIGIRHATSFCISSDSGAQ